MVTRDDIQKMADIIAARFQPEKIILFGSYARGDATEHSDVDLLVVKDSALPRHKRAALVYQMLSGMRCPIDVMVYTQAEIEEWRQVPEAFVSRAVSRGRVLYEKPA